ncbi:abnormal cell migration protein 10 isoform X2 [Contarinia nasturtii]|uniref:abnormal cell migration protein 10 isoform X2 n=1 Tax=Contarinia nasturtii TaxID=265458 RepID=UPI0012D38D1D|nr:abnormal cell migration protein 10 isoform X2 [Contarinia nasturtii]
MVLGKMDYSDYDSSSMYSDESGLEVPNTTTIRLRPHSQSSSERTNSYRFSMANLEETHEAELDAILGELSLLEQHATKSTTNSNGTESKTNMNNIQTTAAIMSPIRNGRTHSRSNSTVSGVTNSSISISSESGNGSGSDSGSAGAMRESRTESPDNDSAFSDTVSLLSSESSASSNISNLTGNGKNILSMNLNLLQCDSAKAAKIHLALQKLEQASIRRLFVKAFTADGASKSLLVDESMTCGHVTRLLADKNHVQMEPLWALVEHLPDLQMERLFEDHELLVDNLMNWSNDSKNRVLFLQRSDKVALFHTPEKFLNGTQMAPGNDHDEHTRTMLLDEHFSSGNQIAMEGPLYVKIESKKVWKRYHFVLRASGIYYYPKEKTKSPRDLLCHSLFAGNDVYKGIGWKKKHKAPTEYTFALKSQKETTCSAKGNARGIKMLCAEDMETLEKWVMAIRVAKYGKQLLDNHRALVEDLANEELDKFSSNRSSSIGSIVSSVPSQCSSNESTNIVNNNNTMASSNGRLSRASSSSSSGCLSDENNAFDSDFPTGTIKRKPSMKPNLPLTSMTRQLKERNSIDDSSNPASPERGGTLTRRHSRRRSEESGGSNNSTLKRRPNNCARGSVDSSSTQASSLNSPSTPTTHVPIIINNVDHIDASPISPLEAMPSCMTDSMFSLPPPPEGDSLLTGSTFSLDSLPAPPSPSELNAMNELQQSMQPPPPPPNDLQPIYVSQQKMCFINNINNNNPIQQIAGFDECDRVSDAPKVSNEIQSQPIYVSSIKPSIKAPPYKNPPAYNGAPSSPSSISSPSAQKTVTFADSPILLRRKVCFEDEVVGNQSPQQNPSSPRRMSKDTAAPMPPPRAEGTRLSTISSPRRLADSTSNPPHDFLQDLQRVMRKKWQISQKCKLEPTTTPHEVLGFRDFDNNAAGMNMEYHDTSHYYRESSNVSNWVQEHYGAVTVDNLYANLGTAAAGDRCTAPLPIMKKRPPPPPPKRNTTTVLTHRT